MECKEVEGQWLVLSRHFAMAGGVLEYGMTNIEEFFDSEERAVEFAEKLLMTQIERGSYDPHVWVLRCERTYVKNNGVGGFCYSKYDKVKC